MAKVTSLGVTSHQEEQAFIFQNGYTESARFDPVFNET